MIKSFSLKISKILKRYEFKSCFSNEERDLTKQYEFDKYLRVVLRMRNKETKFDQFSPKISKILKRYEFESCFSNEEQGNEV